MQVDRPARVGAGVGTFGPRLGVTPAVHRAVRVVLRRPRPAGSRRHRARPRPRRRPRGTRRRAAGRRRPWPPVRARTSSRRARCQGPAARGEVDPCREAGRLLGPGRVGRGEVDAGLPRGSDAGAHVALVRHQPVAPQPLKLALTCGSGRSVVDPDVGRGPAGGVVGLRPQAGHGVVSAIPRLVTSRSTRTSSGAWTTSTRWYSGPMPFSTMSGTSCRTTASAGAAPTSSAVRRATSGWVICSSARRRSGSANTRAPSTPRSREPSGASAPAPNSSTTAARPGVRVRRPRERARRRPRPPRRGGPGPGTWRSAGVGSCQRRERAHRRRLARPGWTEQPEDLALFHREGDAVQHLHGLVALVQVLDDDRVPRFGHSSSRLRPRRRRCR